MSTVPTKEASQLGSADWEQVHERVQALLEPLVARVRQCLPAVDSQGGKTATRAFPLFSYRSFCWPQEPDLEAVIVGLDLELDPHSDGVVIRGDIGGEETGHTYYAVPEKRVAGSRSVVLATASEVAAELSTQVEVVVNALHERRRPPNYRSLSE